MTHDHGLIPIKYLGVENGVNVTLGLPFVRTSPDHGTAFDIAGQRRGRSVEPRGGGADGAVARRKGSGRARLRRGGPRRSAEARPGQWRVGTLSWASCWRARCVARSIR